MKKLVLSAILPILLLAAAAISAQTKNQSELKTVSSVDLKRYGGKWFEIARYPSKFQKQCVGNTTATYTIKTADRIEVLNQCVKKDGVIADAKGDARIVDKTTNAKLEVRFAPKFLSFISSVWGDYWIIDLDENYQYAAVVLIEIIVVRAVMHAMMRGSVQYVFERTETFDFIRVNEKLINQIKGVNRDHHHGRKTQERERSVENPMRDSAKPTLTNGDTQVVVIARMMYDVKVPEEAYLVAEAMKPVVTKIIKQKQHDPRPPHIYGSAKRR